MLLLDGAGSSGSPGRLHSIETFSTAAAVAAEFAVAAVTAAGNRGDDVRADDQCDCDLQWVATHWRSIDDHESWHLKTALELRQLLLLRLHSDCGDGRHHRDHVHHRKGHHRRIAFQQSSCSQSVHQCADR